MVLSNKEFARPVITVFIIYGSTLAKNWSWVPCIILKVLKCNIGKNLVMTIW